MSTMTCKGYGNSKFDIIKCKSKWILNIFYSCFTHAKALDVSHHVMLCCWFSHDSDREASEASPTNLFQSEQWVIMNLSRVYHDMSRTLSNIIERGCRQEWKIDSSFWEHCVLLLFLTSTQLFTASRAQRWLLKFQTLVMTCVLLSRERDAMTNSKLPSAHLTRRHHQHHQFVVRMWASQKQFKWAAKDEAYHDLRVLPLTLYVCAFTVNSSASCLSLLSCCGWKIS